ncbi:MAG: GTPase HflX, partial [Gammaproteobacteria bacterium]
KTLQGRLAKIKAQRSASRKSRKKSALPTISLVGYTNAGKSTLFNLLTQDQVYVANQLFATLDPTLRRIQIPGVGDVILVDTVGFVQNLPHQLIEAFSATLEETRDADLLLHVIDATDTQCYEKIEHVNEVLKQIHADKVLQLQVFNKIDQLPEGQVLHADDVAISAKTGQGIVSLEQAIAKVLASELIKCKLLLSADMGGLRAQLFAHQAILQEQDYEGGGWLLTVQLHRDVLRHILHKAGIAFEDVQVLR